MLKYTGNRHDHEGLQMVIESNQLEVDRHRDAPQLVVPVPPPPLHTDLKSYEYFDERENSAVPPPSPQKMKRKFLGLRKTTFCLTLLLLIIIAGVAVVVVVFVMRNSKMTSQSALSPTTPPISATKSTSEGTITSTVLVSSPSSAIPVTAPPGLTTSKANTIPTNTASGDLSVPTNATVAMNCPLMSGQTQTSKIYISNRPSATRYVPTCGLDCESHNIFPIMAYSLDACVQACVNFNDVAVKQENVTTVACVAVVLRADMAITSTLAGNCFLKSACKPVLPSANRDYDANDLVYATLL